MDKDFERIVSFMNDTCQTVVYARRHIVEINVSFLIEFQYRFADYRRLVRYRLFKQPDEYDAFKLFFTCQMDSKIRFFAGFFYQLIIFMQFIVAVNLIVLRRQLFWGQYHRFFDSVCKSAFAQVTGFQLDIEHGSVRLQKFFYTVLYFQAHQIVLRRHTGLLFENTVKMRLTVSEIVSRFFYRHI